MSERTHANVAEALEVIQKLGEWGAAAATAAER